MLELRSSLQLQPTRNESISLSYFSPSVDLTFDETHWDDGKYDK